MTRADSIRLLWRALATLAIAIGLAMPAGALPVVNQHLVRMKAGDDPRWADPALDDSSWPEVRFSDVPETGGIVILRARVPLEARHFAEGRPTGVFLAALASCELAWDGDLIGQSGRPAPTAGREIPGPVQAHWVIPDRLATAGEHVAALRCSAHHRHFRPVMGYWILLVGEYDTLLSAVRGSTRFALASLSGMVMVGIFALVLFLVDRRDRSFLLLGLVCLSGGALLLAESWRTVFGYTYDWHFTRLLVVTALAALLNLAIAGFVLVRFPGRFARRVMVALTACLGLALLFPGWDGKALLMFIAGLALATGWVIRAVRRREHGSLPALTGLVVTLAALLWRPVEFTDVILYFAIDFLLACLLVAHALQLRRFRRQHEEVLVRSARLEIELLRKHIQPHFLMNTLTALSEWIEQDPAVAVSLIESISQEFRLLGRIADRTLIGLGEELDLCRTHIAILSRRRDRNYELRVEGTDARDLVPPAVFHTLVENAITHDESKRERVVFTLSATSEGERVRYVFTAPHTGSGGARPEGTGLRYIRARLQESLGDDWSLTAGPTDGLWRTELTMPRKREP
jgi:hypothetical protein